MNSVETTPQWAERLGRSLGLVAEAARAVGLLPRAAVARARASLVAPPATSAFERGGLSGLNHDGTPVQAVFGLRRGAPPRLRLVVDPCSHLSDPVARDERVRASLYRACDPLIGNHDVRLESQRLHEALGPCSDVCASSFTHGPAWLATALNTEAAWATYVDTSVYDIEEGWRRVQRWLEGRLSCVVAARRFCAFGRKGYWVSSAAVAGANAQTLRLKVYLIMRDEHVADQALATVAPPLRNERLHRLLTAAIEGHRMVRDSVHMSAGFQPNGTLGSAKVDLGVASLGWSGAHTWDRICTVANLGGWTLPPIRDALLSGAMRLSFIGLGASASGKLKCSLYFKPGPDTRPWT